jgi:DNA-binding transcriptional regulator YiaG
MPGIIRFLGYVPFETGESLPERLKSYRQIHGLSSNKLAHILSLDEGTLWRWETGRRRPAEKYVKGIQALLATARPRDQ